MRNRLGSIANSSSSRKTALVRFKTPLAKDSPFPTGSGGIFNTHHKKSNADLPIGDGEPLASISDQQLTDLSISQILHGGQREQPGLVTNTIKPHVMSIQ